MNVKDLATKLQICNPCDMNFTKISRRISGVIFTKRNALKLCFSLDFTLNTTHTKQYCDISYSHTSCIYKWIENNNEKIMIKLR